MREDSIRRKRVIWAVLPVAVVVGLLLTMMATSDSSMDRAVGSHLLGEVAPVISGHTIDGDWFDIDDQRGRWVVVNFFSTTCVPCVIEHPELVEFSRAHAGGDAVVVSISFDDSAANVADFFARNGGDWPVLAVDTAGVAVRYGVTGVPESYLVAPNGAVVAKMIGGVTAIGLQETIARVSA